MSSSSSSDPDAGTSSVKFVDSSASSSRSPASSPTRLIGGRSSHSRHTSEQTPSVILKQLTTSIPEKEYKLMYDWKVTQACITKVAQSSGSQSDEKKKGGVVAPGGRRLSRMGTSKIHKFKPPVSMSDALTWLSEYGNADSTLVFENDCCLMFKASSFQQLEDVRDEVEPAEGDEDDEDGDEQGQRQQHDKDDDDDDDEEEDQQR